jgi:hypothetical protein
MTSILFLGGIQLTTLGIIGGVRPHHNVLTRSTPRRIGRFSARTGSSVRPCWPVSAG